MGCVAHASDVVGRKHFHRIDFPIHLYASVFLHCYSATDGLPGTNGVDLQLDGEPARGNTHARELHIQHTLRSRTSNDRGIILDL